jgi:Ni/Co efflux regulator RcnB
MNSELKNERTKHLTFKRQSVKLLVMRRILLALVIVTCFIATSFAQSSRKKPQYKSTAKQTQVVKESNQRKTDEQSKAKEQPKKKSEPRYEAKRETRRKSEPKETDRFIDKDNNGVNDLKEKRKEKDLPENFLDVIEKLLKKIKGKK